ncbi:FadR/GntR family transcriptional regulator [Paenacidovorax monticola]|uniref:FadR family transcriptional regulator n=1 Tax=Paenacidovorax monticola TaxID=1926868 RepID=A0A7H0HET0_9BURK|nr:FadR/GntR family transcriptional regulator [Paenacidovorax monticola]QNP59046.1 FadR family transcriptional regulator [Paenacidovorax monticola]
MASSPSQSPSSGKAGAAGTTLAERVAHLLAQQIRTGTYPVNARLPTESAMSEQYGVSRTVVREAVSRLRSDGLVETRQGSGTVVCDPRASDAFRLAPAPDHNPAQGVLQILELRRGIEAEMAALAAERRSAAEMKQIQAALEAIDTAVAAGGDGVAEDLAFHLAISRAAHNSHYTDLLGMLTRALQDAIHVTRSNEARREGLAQQVRAEHQMLCDAIRARDPQAAREAAHGHMGNTAARLRKAGRGFWTGSLREAAQRLANAKLGTVLRTKN